MKKWIIFFSVIAIIMMIVSPYIIFFVVKSDAQGIGFFASYLGGIFGGIVSGGLTLGGVYLTIQHQNKLLKREKAEKFGYVYGKLISRFWSLNASLENERNLSEVELVDSIRRSASSFRIVIEENMHIIQTDYKLLKHTEIIAKWLGEMVALSNSGEPNSQMIESFENMNRFIQQQYEWLKKYERSLY